MEEDKRYRAAKKHANDIRGFFSHLVLYISVTAFLAMLNLFIVGRNFPWALILVGIWSIPIVMHAWEVFGQNTLFDEAWEERKIAEFLGEKSKRKKREDYFEEASTE